MTTIHVCPLTHVETVATETRPARVISLLDPQTTFPTIKGYAEDRHHRVSIDDIADAVPGFTAPEAPHVERLVTFLEGWDPDTPLLVHCWAGISRSTATAFIGACLHNPQTDEGMIAKALRRCSPTAFPNRRIIALADDVLGRDGRMVAAIEGMGRGMPAMVAEPFSIPARYSIDQPNTGE